MRRAGLLLGLLACLPGCRTDHPAWLDLPPLYEARGVRVHTEGIVRTTVWTVAIAGVATNVTDEDLVDLRIRYEAFDKLGQKVGTGIAERDRLAPGAEWHFKAWFREKDVREVDVVSSPSVRVGSGR